MRNIKVLNVCKGCLKSGISLSLNKDLLCDECALLGEGEMTLKEISNILAAYANGKMSKSKVDKYINACEEQRKRKDKNFDAILKIHTLAKKYEREGKIESALNLYIENLQYLPNGTEYYTRPCILLEKEKDYKSAIVICDLAIQCIREKRFNADENEFIQRRERLISKVK